MEKEKTKEFITVDEAVKLTGYSKAALYNYISLGLLEDEKIGNNYFFKRDRLLLFLGERNREITESFLSKERLRENSKNITLKKEEKRIDNEITITKIDDETFEIELSKKAILLINIFILVFIFLLAYFIFN